MKNVFKDILDSFDATDITDIYEAVEEQEESVPDEPPVQQLEESATPSETPLEEEVKPDDYELRTKITINAEGIEISAKELIKHVQAGEELNWTVINHHIEKIKETADNIVALSNPAASL